MQTKMYKTSDEKIILSAYVEKPRQQISFTGAGRTKQSFKAECDINNIMARFLKTGVLEFTQKNQPRYGDVTGLEYQSAINLVAGAKSMFNQLPAQLRDRFENEPAKFYDFVQNPRNREECEEMGLLAPKAVPDKEPLPPSHREDGRATHEPLRAPDGTYREHTRAETRAEAKAEREARGKASEASDAPKTN